MITTYFKEQTTPKKLAQQLLMDAINAKLEFVDEDDHLRGMTQREKDLVIDQINKIADRLAKQLGYETTSNG